MADPQTGMEKPEMKRLVMVAKSDPINLSLGLTKDGSTALLLMDKLKNPRAVEKLLSTAFKDAKDLRFGTGSVNADVDPKLMTVTLNRAVGNGIARKLIRTLKGTGITKLVLNLEDGTEFDRHVSEEEDEGDAGGAPAATAQVSAPAAPAQVSAPAAPVETSAPPLPAAADLQHALAGLIPGIAKADPARRAELVELAQKAGAQIKQGQITQAVVEAIDHMREIMGSATAPGAPQGGSPQGAVAYAKSRLAWLAARQHVEKDLDKLRDALAAEYRQTPSGAEILQRYANRVSPVMAAFDEELADALDDAVNATDPAKRADKVDGAKVVINRYKAYLESENLIYYLDNNPFVPLAIRKTVSATLSVLESTVH
jgi:hypothetical protein